MREVHPTARFLGIVAGGEFTAPARQFVHHRDIDLFYVPKSKIVAAFANLGLQMDYPDRSPEPEKATLADQFERSLTRDAKEAAACQLKDLVGQASINSYVDRVRAALGALPQEIRILARKGSAPAVFASIAAASQFLHSPVFDFASPVESYLYQITYADGSEFERDVYSLDELRSLHSEIEKLAKYVA